MLFRKVLTKRTYRIIFGEGLEEIVVLLIIFGPLSTIFESTIKGIDLFSYITSFIAIGIFLFILGAKIEVESNKNNEGNNNG